MSRFLVAGPLAFFASMAVGTLNALAGGPVVPPPPPPPADVAPIAPVTQLVPVSDEPPAVPDAPPAMPDAPPAPSAPAPTAAPPEGAPAPSQPVTVTPVPPPVYYDPTVSAPCAPPCPAPCPATCPCFQRRDSCGWPVNCRGCRYGRWDITVEGMYSMISDPEGPLGIDTFFPNQLRWDALDYEGEIGARGAISYRATSCDRIELRVAWFGTYDDTVRQTGVFGFAPATPAPPMFPGLIPGVSAVNTGDFHSEAELYTGELNWWEEQLCEGHLRFESVLGLRSIFFTEEARADNFAVAFGPGFPAAPFIASDVDNWFIGLQGGGAAHWDLSQCFTLSLSGKGMVGNMRRQIDVSDSGIFSGGAHSSHLEDDEIVFGAELELGFKWRICGGRLSITGGYSFLFIDGVQRANDAMYFGASTSGAVQAVSDTDQLIVHSVFLGLSVNF